jgi:hypothetical protein
MECNGRRELDLSEDAEKRQALVNTVMNFRVP